MPIEYLTIAPDQSFNEAEDGSWEKAERSLAEGWIDEKGVEIIWNDVEPMLNHKRISEADSPHEETLNQVREIVRKDLAACRAWMEDPESAGTIGDVPAVEKKGETYIFRAEVDGYRPRSRDDLLQPYWRMRRLSNVAVIALAGYDLFWG